MLPRNPSLYTPLHHTVCYKCLGPNTFAALAPFPTLPTLPSPLFSIHRTTSSALAPLAPLASRTCSTCSACFPQIYNAKKELDRCLYMLQDYTRDDHMRIYIERVRLLHSPKQTPYIYQSRNTCFVCPTHTGSTWPQSSLACLVTGSTPVLVPFARVPSFTPFCPRPSAPSLCSPTSLSAPFAAR